MIARVVSMLMVPLVKVGNRVGLINYSCFACHSNDIHKEESTIISDVNECNDGSHTCSPHATCSNQIGSFSCDCKDGFDGNGTYCEGRQ